MSMTQRKIYKEIRRRCHLVCTERSKDYGYRKEHWKIGNIVYIVLIRVTPCQEIIRRISGCVIKKGAIYNVGI